MNPGELNTRIIIKQLIKSADGFGGFGSGAAGVDPGC